jgi:hypothetical protein
MVLKMRHPLRGASCFRFSTLTSSFVFLFFFFIFHPQLKAQNLPSRYDELLDYVIASPDQQKAGSCLYMASTGAVEVVYNKLKNQRHPEIDGPGDFSEVYALRGPLKVAATWYEGPSLRFRSGSVLNKDVPYDPAIFWDQYLGNAPRYKMPFIMTKKIFVATGGDDQARWKIGVMTENTITEIKKSLVEKASPVVVIFRDSGYEKSYGYWDTWHVVTLVGYDDNGMENEEVSDNCISVKRGLKGPSSFPKAKLKDLLDTKGCRSQGVFFVRESEDKYPGGGRIRPPVIKRSYDWLKYLGNHAFSVYSDGTRRWGEIEQGEDFSSKAEKQINFNQNGPQGNVSH